MALNPAEIKRLADGRPYEEQILAQWNFFSSADFYSDAKRRLEEFDLLYKGDWSTFAKGMPKPEFANNKPLVENAVKQATHDISALAHGASSSSTFIPRGDKEADDVAAAVEDSIADTLYEMGGGPDLERKLYMDSLASSLMSVAITYRKGEDYPCYRRLNPRYCYPDVRDGVLQNMLYVEVVKTREASHMYPSLGEVPAGVDAKCRLIDYYDDYCVTKAIVFTRNGQNTKTADEVRIVEQWEHKLDCVPLAFAQADTADGGMRGHFDQSGTALVARSNTIGFLMEYMESMVHAPFEEKNIRNNTVVPGPFVIYHHDRTEQESFMRRVAPAAPAGAVFGVVQILEEATSGETTQPPGRQGQVQQSQASAAFVASTQGRLTSVVQELQGQMARLRKRMNIIGFKIIEQWYTDKTLPLVRAVGKKKTFTSKDIDGWYFHTVQFGIASGISRAEADVRTLQFLGAKAISRAEMRRQIDFIANPGQMQNEIDQEAMQDAGLQRIATDPRVPPSSVLKAARLMKKEGKELIEAWEEIEQELKAAEEAALKQQQGAGAPGETTPGVPAADEQLALQKGATGGQSANGQDVEFQPNAMQTQFVTSPR